MVEDTGWTSADHVNKASVSIKKDNDLVKIIEICLA